LPNASSAAPPAGADSETVDRDPLDLSTGSEILDEGLGEKLDEYLEALRTGTQFPVEKPEAQAEYHQLRPVVEQLHGLAGFLAHGGVEQPDGDRLEAIDLRDRPAEETNDSHLPELAPNAEKEKLEARGRQIGKFQIVRKLGSGGQAGAYLAFDPDLRRHVVIKLYHQAATAQEQERIFQEGQALARVRSPYVAQCFSAERHEGYPYLVVEYIPGSNLAELHRRRPLTLDRALEVTRQVAEGLAAVHACGLLHRDIKPANIQVGDDGLPRLVDFGLAAPLAGDALRRVSGTLAYMAPEQARGEVERIDPRTDLFGVGAVLYELVTGRPPYRAADLQALWAAARAGEVVPSQQYNPKLPAAVNDLCLRCLAKHPGHRFASAAELVQAIRTCERRPGWMARHVRLLLAGTAATFLLFGALVIWYIANRPADGTDADPGRAENKDTSVPPKKDGPPVRPTQPAARHPNGRLLRHDFAIQVEVINKALDARGRYQIIEEEKIRFRIQLPHAAYVGVWHYDDEGNVIQLFPNSQLDRTHLVAARQWQEIPSDDRFAFAASTSKRLEYLHVVASTAPWDPPISGLRGIGKNDSFLVVDPKVVDDLTRGLTQVRVEKVAEAVLAFKVVPKKAR
jgi:hypothetical protein